MHLSTVEAFLEYDVREPSHFCFNIEAAHWPTQRIVSEHLRVSPDVRLRSFEDPGSGNRFIRFDAMAGPLQVQYKADVEVDVQPLDPALPEVPVNQVPDAILHYLMPTRYCESDMVSPFARETFGRVPPGIARARHMVD